MSDIYTACVGSVGISVGDGGSGSTAGAYGTSVSLHVVYSCGCALVCVCRVTRARSRRYATWMIVGVAPLLLHTGIRSSTRPYPRASASLYTVSLYPRRMQVTSCSGSPASSPPPPLLLACGMNALLVLASAPSHRRLASA